MKLSLPSLLLILTGALLIYAGYKDKDPRNVVFEALGIKQRVKDPQPVGAGQSVGKWMQPSATTPQSAGGKVTTV